MTLGKTNFSIHLQQQEDSTLVVKVGGYLDENAKLDSDGINGDIRSLIIDFEDLMFINSIGIRYWIDFIGSFEKRENLSIFYRNCHKQVVESMNTISGFLPKNAKVESFFAPVFCGRCDNGFEVFQTSEEVRADKEALIKAVSKLNCQNHPHCKGSLDIDFNPKTYYQFLSY